MGLISDGRWEKDVWEVSPLPKAPRAKPVAAGDLRGDIDGSGRVDEIDVIFLFAWLAAQAELPGSRPELGDIDDDDDVDWLDLALLGAYVHTEETPTENPYGIGELIAQPLTGRLEPDPGTVDWSQLGQWHFFTLRLEGGRANAAGDDRSLGMQSWRPSQGSCRPRQPAVVYKRRNETFYVAACSGGASSITVEVFGGSHTDGRGNPWCGMR